MYTVYVVQCYNSVWSFWVEANLWRFLLFVYIFTVIEEPFIKRVQLTNLNLPHFYACLKPFLCSMMGGGSWLFVLIILVELFRRSYHIGGTVQTFLSYWWNCSDVLIILVELFRLSFHNWILSCIMFSDRNKRWWIFHQYKEHHVFFIC